MAIDYTEYLHASNGVGEAVRAHVVAEREVGSLEINVDTVLNYPAKFIATSGMLDPATGTFDDNTVSVFYAHINGTYIEIDEFAPGYSDIGNQENEIIVIKPTTPWADKIAQAASSIDAKEDLANKSDNTALGTSTSLYPTQHAVKSYIDTGLSAKQDASNAVTTNTSQTITGDKTFTGTVDLSGAEVVMPKNILQIGFSTAPVSLAFPATWTYYKMPFDKVIFSLLDTKSLALSANGIKIGAGISLVKINLKVAWYNTKHTDHVWVIFKNGVAMNTGAGSENSTLYLRPYTAGGAEYAEGNLSDYYMYVSENDVLDVRAANGATGNENYFNFCNFSVEVIR